MFSSFVGFTYFVIGAIALCEQEMHNMYGFGNARLFLALFLLLILDMQGIYLRKSLLKLRSFKGNA